jgi:HD-GYP domain-containing protein (c-di-GMP phosphodiesterase class II)
MTNTYNPKIKDKDKAIQEIIDLAGISLDPEIVNVFIDKIIIKE